MRPRQSTARGKCPQQIFPIPEPMLYVGVVVKKLHYYVDLPNFCQNCGTPMNKEALEILRRRYESKMEN